MGSIVNYDLLNRADYEDFGRMKEMLALYNSHERNAERGDSVAHSILIDLQTAIYTPGVLTKKQLEAVELYFMHFVTQEEIGAEFSVSRRAIGYRLDAAIKNIQKILLSGKLFLH